MSVIAVTSKEEWDKYLADAKDAKRLVVVDFTESGCGLCRAISSYFEELCELNDGIMFLKVDVEEVESVAAEYNISTWPTFLVFKDGQKVEELVGPSKNRREVEELVGPSKDKLLALVQKYSK